MKTKKTKYAYFDLIERVESYAKIAVSHINLMDVIKN